MSDTPETDKAEDRDPMMYDDWAWIVPANFARRLERERDEAREELARVRKELVAANRGAETNAKVNQGLCARLAEAERERDEFAIALRRIAGMYSVEKSTFQLACVAYEMSCVAKLALLRKEEA